MKFLLSLILVSGISLGASAATGQLVYEAAASSITHASVTLSSTTATLISKAATTTQVEGTPPISWYSLTLFNVTSSSGAYAFGPSGTVAPSPALTCNNGIPLGAGSATAPWWQTEQFFGFYMYGISCANNATMPIKVVYRGR